MFAVRRILRLMLLVALLVPACLAGAGCGMTARARLWADTALPAGGMSLEKHQWAYDGEPVTFELECDPGVVNYVVFGTSGDETVVNSAKVEGRYRWTHVFRAGPKPQTCEVYAVPYLIRGKCDYVYDKADDKWYYYPGASEKPDLRTDSEKRMKITCYRVELRMRFAARGDAPTRVELSLTKPDGERTVIPRRLDPSKAPGSKDSASAAAGFLLTGPANGMYEVAYSPKHSEVGRAGKTLAELVVEHADGSVERLRQDLSTP